MSEDFEVNEKNRDKNHNEQSIEKLSDSLQSSTEEVSDSRSEEDIRESAATQYRHWVRITRVCNQRCLFCLDSEAQNGEFLSKELVEREIERGWKGRGGRLILSGGEASIHPLFIDFISFGRSVGFEHIQTITNGRMFSKKEFLTRAADAGLNEITFSIHGHKPEIHDKLVGVNGAFKQAIKGIRNALEDGRIIVNIDICINKLNYKYLDDMLKFFQRLGVHEFDLLQIIPFGRAWENRDLLMYDIDEAFPYLNKAFSQAKNPMNFIWTNRFPVQHLEGLEELIQEPHKLHDEVRGRREQFERYIETGEKLSCFGERCKYCFINGFCRSLYDMYDRWLEGDISSLSVDLSGRHAADEFDAPSPSIATIVDNFKQALDRFRGVRHLHIEAPKVSDTASLLDELSVDEKQISLGLTDALDLNGLYELSKHYRLVRVATESVGEELFELLQKGFLVEVRLNAATALFVIKHVKKLEEFISRNKLVFGYTPRSLVSQVKELDTSWRCFFSALSKLIGDSPLASNIPPCFGVQPDPGELPLHSIPWIDLFDEQLRLSIHRFVEFYIRYGYFVKSLRCKECMHNESCRGAHINYIRRFGFAELKPFDG